VVIDPSRTTPDTGHQSVAGLRAVYSTTSPQVLTVAWSRPNAVVGWVGINPVQAGGGPLTEGGSGRPRPQHRWESGRPTATGARHRKPATSAVRYSPRNSTVTVTSTASKRRFSDYSRARPLLASSTRRRNEELRRQATQAGTPTTSPRSPRDSARSTVTDSRATSPTGGGPARSQPADPDPGR